MTTLELCAAATLACVVDRMLGDPAWLPHPVRAIGRAATRLEPWIVARLGRTRLAGALFVLLIVGGTYAAAWASLTVAGWIAHALELALATYLLYTAVAARDLDREADGVTRALRASDLPAARRALARIVGRDTQALDPPEVIRGAVESVAESSVDGCISPLFYALLGGPAAALGFKAVNTLDSMVGHRDARYLEFGACAARTDDVLGWLPARIARVLFPAAAWLCGLRARACWRIAWRDGAKSPSPNAGISEAAAAGALGVQLGGVNFYAGEPETRPPIGDATRALAIDDIPKTVRWMYASTGLALLCFAGVRLAWARFFSLGLALSLTLALGLSPLCARAEAPKPRRIASLAVSTDEILLSLVSPERVVAVSRFSHDPQRSHVAELARRIEVLHQPDAAALLAREPDLVLLSTRAPAELEALLRSAGVRTERIAAPRQAEDIRETVRRIAAAVAEPAAGEALIQRFDAALRELDRDTKQCSSALYYTPGQWTSGRDTSLDLVLRLAGLRNAADELSGHQRISLEWLLERDPELLLVPSGYRTLDGFAEQLREDPRLASLRAIQRDRIIVAPSRELMVMSHFVVDAARALRARIGAVKCAP